MKESKLDEGAACPCDSGLSYGLCCFRKGIEYFVSSKGQVAQRISIHPLLEEELIESQKRFKKIFGRKPGKHDLVLFDQFLHGEEDGWQAIRNIARTAETREELIFAWRRSGFIVGEETKKIMPDTHYEEWEDAIHEYFDLKNEGADPFFIFTYLDAAEYETYKQCVELIDNVIVIGFNAIQRRPRLAERHHYFQYLMLCSALNSYRTINEMYRSRYDDDCLAILRGIYEQYLRIKMLRLKPESVERLEAAIFAFSGLYHYKKRSDGSFDYTVAVDPDTNRSIKLTVSNHSIAKISDFKFEGTVYGELYGEMSAHVHHDVAAWALKGIITNHLDLDRDQDSIRAIVLILFVSVLLLKETLNLDWIPKRNKRDLRHTAKLLCKLTRRLAASDNVLKYACLPPCVVPILDIVRNEL